ncbi:MAG: multidrug ABC transporter substrate-binding protein [Acidobacteria bacterium]|nr:MAG: multidrug ABC transporter substrate-binding protein [Acidobacteriota bacterium]REK04503.1 MAG: multidrug ABC transporter substrate-binding protein [Acidobacteriota bacterium]
MRNLLKPALRSAAKTPLVTLVAVLSLALGIGANAAIFSIFETLLLRSLPVQAPGELVNLTHTGPMSGSISTSSPGGTESIFSYPMFRDLEREQSSFTGIAGHRSFGANLAFDDQTMGGNALLVSGSYFPVLGMRPEIGRLFGPADDRVPGSHMAVVLTHRFWSERFDADPLVLNRQIVVNGHPMTVVGVGPRGFRGTTVGDEADLFVPLSMRGQIDPGWNAFDNRQNYWVYAFARLRDGVSLEEAQSALNVPYRSIIQEIELPEQHSSSERYLADFRDKQLVLVPGQRGQSNIGEEAGTPLLLLLGVTFLVLLIACANIANLLLNKASQRAGEIALRMSLGARRAQVVRQLLAESFLIAAAGGVVGIAVAYGTLQFFVSALPSDAGPTFEFALGPSVWLFMAALSLLVGFVGLYPALHCTRTDLAGALKNQTTKASSTRAAARFRAVMATGQIAMSTALLIGAGLFVRSLINVSQVDLGIEVDHLATFGVAPELNGYRPEQAQAYFQRVEEELSALPGVRSVSASMVGLISGNNWGSNVSVDGFDTTPDSDTHSNFSEVGPGFFATVGIPLLAGREFTLADVLGAPGVAIVNERFAEKFELGGSAAVGRRMQVGSGGEFDLEIVGVVQNAKYSGVQEEVPPLFYLPYKQNDDLGFNNFYVRASGDPETLLASIREKVRALDPALPIERLRTMELQVRESLFLERLMTTMSAAFAALATLLAAIGLYGVLAYAITQRNQEIGLRMALGADGQRVRRLVFKELAWMAVPGALIGLLAALGLGRVASSLLYDMQGHDPSVFALALLLLLTVTFGAGLAPALRASRIDPMRVLREE